MSAALLFDLDGTLILSDPIHEAVFIELYRAHGIEIDEVFFRTRIHGRQNVDIFSDTLPNEDAMALAEYKEAQFRKRLKDQAEVPVTPGLQALLAQASSDGLRTAVVTNAPRANAEAMLGAAGLSDRFDTVVIGDECAKGKPDQEPYLEAMRRLGVAAEDSIAFEDSPSGITSARRAGAYTVGMRSTLDDAALRAAGAKASIKDFTDPALPQLLERYKGAYT